MVRRERVALASLIASIVPERSRRLVLAHQIPISCCLCPYTHRGWTDYIKAKYALIAFRMGAFYVNTRKEAIFMPSIINLVMRGSIPRFPLVPGRESGLLPHLYRNGSRTTPPARELWA